MCSTSSPGPNCFPDFVWFVFWVHFHHIPSKICLLAACDLWWLTVFHACNKNSLWDFFSLPFPSALTHVFTVWFACIGSTVWDKSQRLEHQWPKKTCGHTESARPLGQIQMILRWFWQPPLTEINYPCCALKQKAKHIHNAGISKNKNKKLGEEKKGFMMSLSRFHTEQHISDEWWFNSKV